MRSPGVIERRMTANPKLHLPLRYPNPADQLMLPWRLEWQANRHEILNFGDAARRMEARHKHVGIRPVELFRGEISVPMTVSSNRPPFSSSSMAANTLGESKCGQHSQSIDPFRPTSAAVRMFPMMP